MKKKTVAIIVMVVAVLMLGVHMVYDNIFPKAKPIKQLEISMIESVALSDNGDNAIVITDEELQKLLSYINGAEATRTMSVNDYPSARPYYVLEIKTAERVFRYMIYEENGTSYAEIPYEGVYEIDSEAVEILEQ